MAAQARRHVVAGVMALAALAAPGGVQAQARPVGLEEARQVAAQSNLDLLLARVDRDFAQLAARQARRPFVPQLDAGATVRDETSLFSAGRNRRLDYGAGVSWALPVGTQLSGRLRATEFFAGTSFAPVPTTALELGVVQPFLQGAWGRGNLLEQRDLEIALQRQLFLDQLNAFLVRVDTAYWELAYTQADVAIKERSRDRARKQFEDTRENIRRGLLAPGDIFVVEENLAIFEQQLVRSREALSLAQVRLARLMRVDPGAELVTRTELEVPGRADALARQRVLDRAMERNPALQAQQLAVDQAEVQVRFDQNQILPSLDLSAGLVLNGLGPNPARAWGQVATAQNPDVRAGVTFQVPIVRDPDRARVERAELARRREELALADARDDIRYGVQALLVRIERRRQILAQADRLVELARDKLANEQEKYRSGLSPLVDVVRFQRDLDGALISQQRARVDVLVLLSQLHQLQGTLYERANLRVR